MKYENLLIEISDNVLVLTINRPKALNALNRDVMKELDYFFGTDGPSRNDHAGVVITGAGARSFVAGADITEFIGLNQKEGAALSKYGQDVFFKIERYPKPVIALVNGFALGGGCELAMSCHLRIAEEHAKFGQPEVNLGLIPGYGGTQRLIQYIGKSRAMELLLTADVIGAEEALKIGLVNYVLPAGEGMAKSKEIIHKIATKGPVAISRTIDAVNAYFDQVSNGFETEFKSFGKVINTADSQEGARAFIEKRKADFKGK